MLSFPAEGLRMSQTGNNDVFKNRNTLSIATVMFLRNIFISKTVGSWELEVRETGATVGTNESRPSVNKKSL
jgi:hypothetical protein